MEEITIHEFDFALINEFFTELERQGPGSPEETIMALGFIGNLSNKTKIADLETKLTQGDEKLAAKTGYIDSLESIVRKMNTTIGDLKKANTELQTKLDEALTAEKPEEKKE